MSTSGEGEPLTHMKTQCQERQHHHKGDGRNLVEKTFFRALTVTQCTPAARGISLKGTLTGDLWANMTVYFTVHSYGLIGQ